MSAAQVQYKKSWFPRCSNWFPLVSFLLLKQIPRDLSESDFLLFPQNFFFLCLQEPFKGNLSEIFSPSATSSPTENNNVLDSSVIDTPQIATITAVQNGCRVRLDSSDSDLSLCPECGLADESDSDRNKKHSANQSSGDKSSMVQNSSGPHVQYFTQCEFTYRSPGE